MAEQPRRPDASMTLLTEVMERPLDPGYAAMAERRGSGGARPRGSRLQELFVLLLAIAIGVGGVWAARQLRAPVDSALSARGVLEEQIRDRVAIADGLREDIAGLRGEINELQAEQGDVSEEFLSRARDAAVSAGTIAVTGPGVAVTLEDSTRAVGGDDPARVFDVDLQLVVNALWAAGAEAIAINGHRVSAGTAIRSAGEAILVDLKPLVSPYEVEAIGDPNGLRTEFARSTAAAQLATLGSMYGIGSSVVQAADLALPAGTAPKLHYVTEQG
ncbi:DUF881 domain-containing protein [Pseudactinotalea sp. HY158]|uniref:DUF881 domain-containing protein n=1 Tax=Pseudactinotalea sp. HY158 TaxID=2654547 RepID=UPI00129D1B57|nr:DUF881 domain-containing protein [Pseudactinotalea sp. HY158]QGH69430.1 DUF881 domain-containing protein [Pseudactinotalea sp. HY158]